MRRSNILWALQIIVLRDTLAPIASQPNSKLLSKDRVVYSWLPSFLLRKLMLYPRQVLCHTKCPALSTLMLFLSPLFYLGCVSAIGPFLLRPNWMHLSRVHLNSFSFRNSPLIQPDKITLVCSDGILWLSVFIHHSLPFIMGVYFTFLIRL